MRFDFGKATEITVFAKKEFSDMYSEYDKIFIVPDTHDYHILRILKGFGDDYEEQEDGIILEHQKIAKARGGTINGTKHLKEILEEDDGGNWGYEVKNSIQDCIDDIDGGHGINY